MYIQQLYTNCLAEAAYYIESNGEAAIVDPIRETQPYLELAEKRGAKIKYILETHFHADFVSGHKDLAEKTGAKIVYGPGAKAEYPIYNITDGELLSLGNLFIKAIHTPGHTPESTCYILLDESNHEHCIFTGDTLFVGDVGRPDLLDGVIISKEEQVANLYNTIQKKILPLSDHLIVYPGHGPGSMCGKSIGKETESTIGKEKKTNYALQPMSQAEFASVLLDGQLPAPKYFVQNALINRHGYDPLEKVLDKNKTALTLEAFKQELNAGAVVLDTRSVDVFTQGFIPGALNVSLNGTYAIWVGTLLDIRQRLILICDPGKEHESILRLARVGIENVAGYLEGGFSTWEAAGEPKDSILDMSPEEFAKIFKADHIVDVRAMGEYRNGHLAGSENHPLRDLESSSKVLKKDETYYVHCAGGYRSVIACSLLKRQGIKNVINITGGFEKIKNTGLPVLKNVAVTA